MGCQEISPEEKNKAARTRYIQVLAPLFRPDEPTKPDIAHLFATLLRIGGMEDKGWDPYSESRAILDDLQALLRLELPEGSFKDKNLTAWRLGLLVYSHIVEMSAPYEVLTNLLRFKLGKGYSPEPYNEYLTQNQAKQAKKRDLYTLDKIRIIEKLDGEAKTQVSAIINEFHDTKFRNAIAHADFVFSDDGFRCRSDGSKRSFHLRFDQVDDLIMKATAFIGSFFTLEHDARCRWGNYAGKPIPYDPVLKGVMEILVDDNNLMNGFKIHWPNGSESVYRRTVDGVEMTNCVVSSDREGMEFMVGMYANQPGTFSRLVEDGTEPSYSPLENGSPTTWTHHSTDK